MQFIFSKNTEREDVFNKVAEDLKSFIHIQQIDDSRPWGGFFVIDEGDQDIFIKEYFPDLTKELISISGKISPKILIVAPGKRLSWQYHHRRSEIWKLLGGEIKVVTSDTDRPAKSTLLLPGDIIELNKGERHRIEGLDNWGIVAEIWRHTDAENPSDEDDIVRVEDDFGR
ncbi:MAG: hypothetical protein ABIY51_06925 [Ferruginibacter sp.]